MRASGSSAFLLFFLLLAFIGNAQVPVHYPASDIQLKLEKLEVLGSVLYIAAHPDDENTRLISWLSKDQNIRTAYLSLTRGDGGQNLIGPQIREELGVIRTQELLAARRIDGAEQFFTRANDFGFSKNPDETFNIWDREGVLADMVWVIRKFRPDVLITRFNTTPGITHGHHTASAILAEEAFKAAGDAKRFPEQLKHVEVWQAKRIVYNASTYRMDEAQLKEAVQSGEMISLDVGTYSPLLGLSYNEIAAHSRSQHKSQGFGTTASRGSQMEYLQQIGTVLPDKSFTSIFSGIDISWSRIAGGKEIQELVNKARSEFDPKEPWNTVPHLLSAKSLLDKLPASHWRDIKIAEIKDLIYACAGLYLEAATDVYDVTPGATVSINIEALQRSSLDMQIEKIDFGWTPADTTLQAVLNDNQPLIFTTNKEIAGNLPFSQPYWLQAPGSEGMFSVNDKQRIGLPENPPQLPVIFHLLINNVPLTFTRQLVFKRSDPVKGAVYQPVYITPPVFLNVEAGVYVFPDSKPQLVKVKVRAGKDDVAGKVKLQLPAGWKAEPADISLSLKQKGEEQTVSFQVSPPQQQSEGTLKASVEYNGKQYSYSISEINYDHIPLQLVFPKATAKLSHIDLQKRGQRIGYIMGAGDDIPASLRQIGYQVDMLSEKEIMDSELSTYDAIITGIRAYNTLDRMPFYRPRLMEYVKGGGTLLVQYNTSRGLITEDIGPYPLTLSRDRVTVEGAPVTILKPEHPAMNVPNKITAKDFEGWVQERGLYFPSQWDENYTALLASNDPGEEPLKGGLLVAKYGEGYFIYTGYSWFRELPAGVPGAYRIFVNLLSLGKS